MKICFSEEKLMKQFATPPPPPPPPPFSTNSPISEQFFHDPHLYPNFKNKKPSLILGGGGRNYGNPLTCPFTTLTSHIDIQ